VDLKHLRYFVALAEERNFGRAAARLHMTQPPLTRQIRDRPDVDVRLHTMSKPQQIEALRDRRISMGFNRLVPDVEGVTVETVAYEKLVVGVHKDHPLAKLQTISLAELEEQPLILYPNLPIAGFAQEVEHAFRRERRRLFVVQEVEDVLTCLALVSAGFGSCITPEAAANLQLPNVVYRTLQCRWFDRIELSCLYREDDRSPVLEAFLETVRDVGRERSGVAPKR